MKIFKNKKLWLRIALVVLAVILVLLVAGIIAVEYVLGKIGSANPDETFATIPPGMDYFETDPPEETDPTEVTDPIGTADSTDPTDPSASATEPVQTQPPETQPPETQPAFAWPEVERLQSSDVVNILLIGQDARRSDSMILLSLNKKTNSITLTSFMRDLYVQIPGGYRDNRINAAYAWGGRDLLNATIEKNFGVVIDGDVEVGFDQFSKIINILGGVDVKLTSAEAKHMRSLGYEDIQEGMNHLTGGQALTFCRIRKIDSDHNRTERQRRVLTALANSARSMNAAQMLDLVNQVLPYVRTNLSSQQIIDVATSGLSILASGGQIQSGKVPQSGHYYGSKIMGMQVLVPDLIKCNQYLKQTIYGG